MKKVLILIFILLVLRYLYLVKTCKENRIRLKNSAPVYRFNTSCYQDGFTFFFTSLCGTLITSPKICGYSNNK